MYPLIPLSLFQAFVKDQAAAKLTILLLGIFVLAYLYGAQKKPDSLEDGTPTVPLSSFETIWSFFNTRDSFIRQGLQYAGQKFRFTLLQSSVVIVSGERARAEFLAAKSLDINEGFKILSGAIPMLPGITSNLETRTITLIHRRLSTAQSSERLQSLIPYVLKDIERTIGLWGSGATCVIDPFVSIPALCFQTTVRCLSCHELADDAARVNLLRVLYDKLDTSTTPASVLLPWLPSPSMLTKLWTSKRVYGIINEAVEARLRSGIPGNDTLQILLDHGDEKMVIIGFIMGLLVAGARSTGTTVAWMLTYLAEDSQRRQKAKDEIHTLLSAYTYVDKPGPGEGIAELLSDIPLDAWEKCTPFLDACIRETLRIAQPHTAMRRNMGSDTYVDGTCIPSGSYVVYPFSDVHLNPQLYPDPWRFDPERPRNEAQYSYVGWGGGTTTCLGQRLAKLETKLILATLLLRSDFKLVDLKTNSIPISAPRPDWNDHLHCKPSTWCSVSFSTW